MFTNAISHYNPPRGADLVSAVDIVIIVLLAIIAAIVIYFLRPLIIAIVIIAVAYFIYRWYVKRKRVA
jgi:Flp pilus assembly protein TadB